MLHDNDIPVISQHLSNHSGSVQTLFDIKVRTWLVEHVNVCVLHASQSNDESLELSTRKLSNLTLQYFFQFQLLYRLVIESLLVEVTKPPPHNSLVYVLLFCYRIDILDLDKCLELLFLGLLLVRVTLEHRSEVLLEFRAAEVFEDFSPFWKFLKVAQIWPHVTAQNTEGRRLADTVGAHETKYLACTWRRQSVQLEGVRAVAMSHLPLQSFRQVDDFDRTKRASLNAHAATVAKMLRDEADGRRWLHIDANFANLVHGACLGALLPALFGLALIRVDNGDSELLICHNSFLLLQYRVC